MCQMTWKLYYMSDDFLSTVLEILVSSIERRIQIVIDKVNSWADSHGFAFSATKTQCIHFHQKRKLQPPLKLMHELVELFTNRDSIKCT